MQTFRTVFPVKRAPFALTHADGMLLAGSCFTEHIGRRLADGKFRTRINPNGIVYNPVSIARSLAISGAAENAPFVFRQNGLWHSWEHHGAFSNQDREALLEAIQKSRQSTSAFVRKTSCLLLTLGTADVFVLNESGQVVANCHKAPAGWFSQRRLTVEETVQALAGSIRQLKSVVPALNVILTVSPVRHLGLGLVENQRSKAVLVLACSILCEQLDYAHYFPAYELLLDDLRDYRFYAPDMAHPNELAIDYIWQHFADVYFTAETRQLLAQIEKIRNAAAHRPFNPDTAEHRSFARAQLEKIDQLEREHPGMDWTNEQMHFKQYL